MYIIKCTFLIHPCTWYAYVHIHVCIVYALYFVFCIAMHSVIGKHTCLGVVASFSINLSVSELIELSDSTTE